MASTSHSWDVHCFSVRNSTHRQVGERRNRQRLSEISHVLCDEDTVMFLLANNATEIVQYDAQPHDTLGASFLVSARTIPYELNRLRTHSTVFIHRSGCETRLSTYADLHGKAKPATFHLLATQGSQSWHLPPCASKMSAFSGHPSCSRACGCRSPFTRPAAVHVSRKPFQCRAQQGQTPRQANDHSEQRADGLGRREAILSAAAAILVPMLPLSAIAKIEAPPGTL